ncbi:MAG: cobalt transporter [Devosia sp. 67-54]|uniref:cation diffusion facilitator family transporter n=1 Tax=unclassified Devosia TaxID=196773 RepID=UPI00096711FC|nr:MULTISPECIES: cation diffusion facilitator family transporter [unclassified Devosia]MBN9304934.1 cation transporter [Devosia sp.]OJX15584.1 MAG: cobalt transporter [Devosia sp. 67-54]
MLAKILDWFGFGSPATVDGVTHGHDHGSDGGGHGHMHGVIDPSIAATNRGIWAVKWSFVVMIITALIQLVVVLWSGSVALLADTIHNFGDATTAIPLWVAFVLARRPASKRFTYGLGRVEDIAGVLIVLIILASAIVAGYEAIGRLIHPRPIAQLWWVAAAGIIGFIGNEAVAVFRIRVGREINSAALIADGYHARTDGLTSLAVVLGAIGVALGFPLADPIIGLIITVAIFGIVWQSARAVLTRMLDGVEPGTVDEIVHAAEHVKGIRKVTEAQARWLGHRLYVEATIEVDDRLLVAAASDIVESYREELFHHMPGLTSAQIRIAAPVAEGEHHHAPKPIQVASRLADGLLQIVDTPEGERMQLRVSRHAEGLSARVDIARGSNIEVLDLQPVAGDHHWLRSAVAPAEPHEFSAKLRLTAGNDNEEVAFAMVEPEEHHH